MESRRLTNSSGMPAPLRYGGKVIHDRDAMVSLTDMWRAGGSDPGRKPGEWLRSADAVRFIDFLATTLNVGISHLDLVKADRGGRTPATWAHWQVGLAYAKYLSPEFHIWANTAVRERMEEVRSSARLPAPGNPSDPATILSVMQYLQAEAAQGREAVATLGRIQASEGSRCITDVAKLLDMRPKAMFKFMNFRRWIYRRPATETWIAFQDKQDAGYLELEPYPYTGRDGTPRVRMNVLVTPKGLVKLAALLGKVLPDGDE